MNPERQPCGLDRPVLRGAAALVLLLCASLAAAQAYPPKPIRMMIPIAAGGGTDAMGRLIAQRLGDQMGVSVVVENRAGAGSVIGT